MKMIAHKKYVLQNPNKRELKKHGFRHNKEMSDSEGDFYSLKFPVLQYHNVTTVEGEIVIDLNTGDIRINAYNYGQKEYYSPFYCTECSEVYEPIMKKINNQFQVVFHKLGITEICNEKQKLA